MLRSVKERVISNKKRFGFWQRRYNGHEYIVNLWLTIPITARIGFVAGMVGISGGSFKIPLMVLACGVPMRIAVGTSSAMVAATALMGFVGHTVSGDFNPPGQYHLQLWLRWEVHWEENFPLKSTQKI